MMTAPFMIGGLVLIPEVLSYIALILLVVGGIAEFRQGHIGRIGIAANAFLLWQIFFPLWESLPNLFQWYLNIGTIVGIVALASYMVKLRLPTEFYQISFLGYGSFSVFLAIVVRIMLIHV